MSQEEEVEALTLLYQPDQFHASRDPNTSLLTGWYRAHPKLPRDSTALRVRIHVSSQTKKLVTYEQPQFLRLDNSFCKVFFIQHLPPITVNFTLPQDYPADAIPQLSLESSWILSDRLRSIVDQLNTFVCTRESGEPCMWECFDFLECNLFSSLLGLTKDESGDYLYDIEAAIPSSQTRDDILQVLVDYDNAERRRRFDEERMECPICATAGKLGRECIRLKACKHVACHDCLREAMETHMAEGITTGFFRCLHCNAIMDLDEVKEFATPSQFEAYDSFLLQHSLALMTDVVQCPRSGCAAKCLQENEFQARCPACRHTFCPKCLRVYHPGQNCRPKRTNGEQKKGDEEDTILLEDDEFVSVSTEDIGMLKWRLAHEPNPTKRYEIIRKLVAARRHLVPESLLTSKFLEARFGRCPSCGVYVDKIDGCNTVFCPFCLRNFDYEG